MSGLSGYDWLGHLETMDGISRSKVSLLFGSYVRFPFNCLYIYNHLHQIVILTIIVNFILKIRHIPITIIKKTKKNKK
jgi:hypothetical protein